MIAVERDGLVYYTFASFDHQRVRHGVFTRHGGVSEGALASLNVGRTVGDDPARVQENHRRIYQTIGLAGDAVVTARQVHGDRLGTVCAGDGGRVYQDTDALISGVPDVAILLRFADCVPLFFWVPDAPAVGLAHAGWQGTLKRIAARTAQALVDRYACSPSDIRVGLGPSIGPCCYEVGPEIVGRVRAEYPMASQFLSRLRPDDGAHLDLWQLNAWQLREMGVTRIEVAEICTRCHVDAFYSHRGEGGRTGRFAGIVGLRRSAPGAGV